MKISNTELANILFPEINETIEDLEKRYPLRRLSSQQEVTRFAPSPTGFLHLGSLFTTLIGYKVAHDSNGVFYLRVEDTDTKREVEGSIDLLVKQLDDFHIVFNEGYLSNCEVGSYGPYLQSNRANIYKVVIKELVKRGLAYPCFCTKEEIDELRKIQEKNKDLPGYYGQYAKCSKLTNEEIVELIKQDKPYVIRYRSKGNHLNKITFHDEIRGDILIAENDLDVVILKSDGLPTYHFAHVVDDHFMRTTLVIRGEEWISSAPIHFDMFNALKFPLPRYAHLPVLMKMDGCSRRKLSKRKDKEASVENFLMLGYPQEAILVYLMSVANSNFEQWTVDNNSFDIDAFPFDIQKMSLDGVLFDNDKLDYFAREIIASYSAKTLYMRFLAWAKKYHVDYLDYLVNESDKTIQILNIERGGDKPRKDYAYYAMIYPLIKTFYNDVYNQIVSDIGYQFDANYQKDNIINALKAFINHYDFSLDRENWFNAIKDIANNLGYASRMKDYKNNPDLYLGSIADYTSIIRVAIFLEKNSPNLYDIFAILGKDEVLRRINKAIEALNK